MVDEEEPQNETDAESADLTDHGGVVDDAFDEVADGIGIFEPDPLRGRIWEDGIPGPDHPPRAVDHLPRVPEYHVCMADPERRREACQYQGLQIVPAFGNAEGRQFRSFCTARRNVEGAFVDLTNANVFACNLRVPADRRSLDEIAEWESRVIAAHRRGRREKADV
jgi:hypothetical protein